jgi:hypothetical protein
MRRVSAAYVVLGLGLWPTPLLNVLQVESAAVVAFAAFFVSGISAVGHFQGGERLGDEVLRQEAALLIPLGMLLVAPLWAPNCTLGQGLLFYALFPVVTVAFAVSLAYALTGIEGAWPRSSLVGVGLFVSLAGPVYDLGFHPQLYTYNHVFGGVLGPIYDEQLAVRPGLFAFRGLTLLWAGAAALLGARLRGWGLRWGLPVCLLLIGAAYWFSAPLGFNTPASHLQAELGGHHRTEHFDLYYDPEDLSPRAVQALAADHEAYYAHLHDRLALDPGVGPARIQSYLYPNRDVKARLTGARATSVTPVWLDRPQVHLLVDRAAASLGHELAHVFSRPYGLPGLRASWAPGLVEGWAVALEPPSPYPSPHDLVTVAAGADTVGTLSGKAAAIAERLTPWGFWTGRSAVSYATMGSFVRFLLDTRGPGPLKEVYARGNFEAVYGQPLADLARAWADTLAARPVLARAAHEVVSRRFTRPSLFEKDCPHYVPPYRRHLQAARRAERRGDSVEVDRRLRRAVAAEPRSVSAHTALARRRLGRGAAEAVHRQLDTLDVGRRSVEMLLLRGDAHAMTGAPDTARQLYTEARTRTPRYDHDTRARLLLRRAVADRPAVVRTLVDRRGAQWQARQLAALDAGAVPAVRAWQALRWQDAHHYARADSLWRQDASSFVPVGPRAWTQAWTIQRTAWRAEAAVRGGRWSTGATLARDGAQRAEAHGAQAWAETIAAWGERARRANADALQPHAQ